MDKAITTALFIVISMILALMLFNVAYPAIVEGGDSINSMADRAEERMRTQVAIVHAAAEIDNSGWWQDTNGNGDVDVFVWVKNIGDTRIIALEHTDVFFGPEGNFTRIPHESVAGGSYPYWTGEVENASEWEPSATLKITIHYNTTLSQGRYFNKVTLPNGIWDEYFLSI
jgi:archaellum component FlaG (FlaF/FlaG flagellin family)